jgi:putative OPT family oligopeptide transporter
MKSFTPHVAASKNLKEFSLRAIVLGCLLSLIFGVGNAYLGLKIGTTVSASIPAAVLSMALLRTFFKRATILENNLVQTVASVGEGLAAGVVFTAPALFILGEPPSIFRMFLLSALGGILGVLWMIPMRRYLIVEEHGVLPYPEGVACAAILKSGEEGKQKAYLAILGIVAGSIYKICSSGLRLWKEVATWNLPNPFRSEMSVDCTPALLGVGYIIGPRLSTLLFVGGVLGWWVIIPLIAKFGTGASPIFPGTIPISQMSAEDLWGNYVRYIGAGAVGIGGLISLVKIFPLIIKTFKVGVTELFDRGSARTQKLRTEHDISLKWLIVGSIVILLFCGSFPIYISTSSPSCF